MISKSIKWRLQLWYGLILVVVLAGFGFTAYQLERGRQFRRIDEEIHRRMGALTQQLRGPPRGPGRDRLPEDRLPPEFPDDNMPLNPGRLPKFNLAPQVAAMFDEADTNGFYFTIRGRDGKEMSTSINAPSFVVYYAKTGPYGAAADTELRPDGSSPPPPRMVGNRREMFTVTPPGETILVGKDVSPELHELRMTAFKLVAVGGIVLIFGLAGGWWFVSRALRPIENISAAAVKISAGDLSQRINVAETESELGKLASVLNSTFARLDAAFAQQKQFASDAAHELRTPVTVILTQTQTALNREREAAEYRETVAACQRAAQRMRKLIGALLELARLDAGQEQMKRLRFDFSRTVADGVELVKPLAEENGIKIFTELSPLEITGDAERLAQVAMNLLTNAIQYNQPQGEVRVKLAARDGLAILIVSDTGLGISAEDLPHVFERFYRADKSRTGANAGLGLAISKAIVEAHGGTIEVSSEEDVGTTFTVRLPF